MDVPRAERLDDVSRPGIQFTERRCIRYWWQSPTLSLRSGPSGWGAAWDREQGAEMLLLKRHPDAVFDGAGRPGAGRREKSRERAGNGRGHRRSGYGYKVIKRTVRTAAFRCHPARRRRGRRGRDYPGRGRQIRSLEPMGQDQPEIMRRANCEVIVDKVPLEEETDVGG